MEGDDPGGRDRRARCSAWRHWRSPTLCPCGLLLPYLSMLPFRLSRPFLPIRPFRPQAGERRERQGLGAASGRNALICATKSSMSMSGSRDPGGRPARGPAPMYGRSGARPRRTGEPRAAGERGGIGTRPGRGVVRSDADRRRSGPDRLGVEGTGRAVAGQGEHLVVQSGEIGQGSGPRALRGVDRLPDLIAAFGSGDDVRHTHYVTHYFDPLRRGRYLGGPMSTRSNMVCRRRKDISEASASGSRRRSLGPPSAAARLRVRVWARGRSRAESCSRCVSRGVTLSGCCRANLASAGSSMSSVCLSCDSATRSWACSPAIWVSSWFLSTWSVRHPATRCSKAISRSDSAGGVGVAVVAVVRGDRRRRAGRRHGRPLTIRGRNRGRR